MTTRDPGFGANLTFHGSSRRGFLRRAAAASGIGLVGATWAGAGLADDVFGTPRAPGDPMGGDGARSPFVKLRSPTAMPAERPPHSSTLGYARCRYPRGN